jgi:hypothetical protein
MLVPPVFYNSFHINLEYAMKYIPKAEREMEGWWKQLIKDYKVLVRLR